jgi:hypothetical protein
MSNSNMPRLEDIKVGDVLESITPSDDDDGFVTQNVFLGKTFVPTIHILQISKRSPGAMLGIALPEDIFKSRLENGFYTDYKGPRVSPNLLEEIRLPDQIKGLKNIEKQTPVEINDDVRNNIMRFLRKDENEKIYGGRKKTRKTRKTSRKTSKNCKI